MIVQLKANKMKASKLRNNDTLKIAYLSINRYLWSINMYLIFSWINYSIRQQSQSGQLNCPCKLFHFFGRGSQNGHNHMPLGGFVHDSLQVLGKYN